MWSLVMVTVGYGWAVVGLISVSFGLNTIPEGFTYAGEVLLWTFVLISHLIIYWVPGILVGYFGTVVRRAGKPKDLTF